MASRLKEDEKNEKIIRGLLKLPANRRCINCNSLGPQYVCTNFWTFVCTTCGGIHREFTHRVKSVSMAKFTSQEVSALQGGGNECAREIYFKEWDSQRHSQPDGSNVERLRDFIKHVYVDRRYTGDRNIDKPPRVKMQGDREDSIENRRFDTYRGGSRSPPYEDAYERRNERHASGGRSDDRNFRYSNDERRSPGYDQQSQRQAKRSPARFEVVDDRFRDDRPPNGRRFEDRRSSDGDSRLESKSPNHQKDLDASSPPMVRPVRDILGEDVPPLRVGEPPKENNKKAVDGSAHTQRTASSSSLGSLDGNPVEPKKEISGSLIDFDADPAPPVVSVAPQAQPTPAPAIQSAPQSATSSYPDNNNWASFAFGTQEKVSQGPSNVNTLESVLSQLSAPAAPPVSNMSSLPVSTGFPAAVPVSNISMSPPSVGLTAATLGISSSHGHGAPVVAPAGNISVFPVSGSAPMAAHGGMTFNSGDTLVKASDGGIWANGQQLQHSLFTSSESQSAAHQASRPAGGFLNNQLTSANGAPNNQLTPSVSGNPTQLTPSVSEASNNQQLGYAIAQNVPGTVSTPTPQPTQSKPVQDASSGVPLQPAPVEAKPTGRKELPQDLFTSTYSSIPTLQGWQTRPHHGMGFGMQYPTAMPIAAFPNSAKSSNPFDLSTEPSLGQASVFPSMASMQGALPNMVRPTNLLRTASVGNVPAQWMHPQSPSYASTVQPQSPSYASALQPQSPSYASALQPQSPSYASALRPQSQSYASALPPSAYMGQQASSNMLPFGHQGAGGAGNDGAAFGNLSMDQHLAGRYSLPATPNSFSSVGGNPFG